MAGTDPARFAIKRFIESTTPEDIILLVAAYLLESTILHIEFPKQMHAFDCHDPINQQILDCSDVSP